MLVCKMIPSATDLMKIIDYIRRTTGLNVVPGILSDEARKGLPFYLRKADHREIFIEGRRVILDIRSTFRDLTPGQIAKQKELLEKHYSANVVFCFGEIASYQRKRLITHRVAFVLADKQMFIPFLFLDLKEFGNSPVLPKVKLGPLGQLLLLYHLQMRYIEDIPLGEITKLIPVSAMSVSRGVSELVACNLCTLAGTKTKVIKFLYKKKELWEAALPLLDSPVKKTVFIETLPAGFEGLITGEEALEHYSNLYGSVVNRYAVSSKQYQLIKKQDSLPEINLYDGEFAIEIWNYPPELLTNERYIDPLSLYLIYKDDEDERVQIALNEMIENVRW